MKNIKRLFELIDKDSKRKFFKIQIYSLFLSIANTLTIYLYAVIVLILGNNNDFTQNNFFFKKFQEIVKIKDTSDFLTLFLIFVFLYSFIIAVSNYFLLKKTNLFSNNLAAKIQVKILKFFLSLDYSEFIKKDFNKKTSELIMDTQRLYPIIQSINQFFFHFYNFVFIIILFLFISIKITIINVLFLSFVYFLIYKKFKSVFKFNSGVFSNISPIMLEVINNSLQGFRDIKIYNLEEKNLKKLSELNTIFANSKSSASTLLAIPRFFVESLFIFLLFLIIQVNLNYELVTNLFFVLSIFAISFAKLIPSFQNFYLTFSTIKDGSSSLNKISNIFNENNQNNISFNKKIYTNKNKLSFETFEFKNIEFKYKDRYIFKDFNYLIENGDKIFIKGSTGAGKSTFLDLFTGFLKPSSGEVLLNNQYQSNFYKLLNLKFVSQNAFLFPGTILENITLNSFNDNKIRENVMQICNNLYLEDLILNENDLDIDIGDFANKISGGQKQRILIARAIFSKPEILILDESLNAIDTGKKLKILEYILKLNKNMTLLYVSHDDYNENFNKKIDLDDKNI